MKNIKLNTLHIITIIIGCIFVSLSAFHNNIWFDEAYSIGLARQSFIDIWTIGGNDVHPILYYWLLHIIYLVTNGSIIAYRIFSIIPIIITIILGYTHIKKDFGEKTGFIFSFLSAFLPQMALYAVEIRMYSWAMLIVSIMAIYAYRLLHKDKVSYWIIFGISSLISIYLHYYGLMAAGLINIILLIYLIIKKRKKGIKILITFGIIQIIAYIPWIIYLATQLSNVSKGFWIGFTFPTTLIELTCSQLIGYLKYEIPLVLALELYAYIIYKTYMYTKQKINLKPFYFSLSLYFIIIIAALIMSCILGTSILYYRYLFVITGLYIFAISFILSKEKNKIIIVSILSVILILGTLNNIKMIKNNYHYINNKPISYLKENVQKDDIIIFSDIGVGFVTKIHLIENKTYFINLDNWGVEEAYKAFRPNYETLTNTSIVDNIKNNIWIIDSASGNFADYLLNNNSSYEKVSEQTFYTNYHDYNWKITLYNYQEN